MKRIFSILLAAVLCVGLLVIPVSAATASATLTGPTTVRAGDTITLSFKLNGSGLYGVSGTLSYDTNQLTLSSTKQTVASPWVVEVNGNTIVAYDNDLAKPVNSTTEIFTATYKVKSNIAVGTTVKVSFNSVTATDGNADANIGTVSYSAKIAEPLSTANDLKSLTVSNATISPAFSAGVTSYTAEVPFDVSKLNIDAKAVDKATVTVDNPNLIPGGTTTVKITVKAENGATKVYTISVKRGQDPNYQASGNNNLSGISVNGFLLSPVFSAENTEYVIWLPFETESVTVSGTAQDNKASVSVEGGDSLVAGKDNVIKVICTAENGQTKEYTVIAKRAAAHGDTPVIPPETSDDISEPDESVEDEASVVPETSEPKTEESKTPTTDISETDSEPANGMQPVVVIIIAVVCIALGAVVGFVIGKKKA